MALGRRYHLLDDIWGVVVMDPQYFQNVAS